MVQVGEKDARDEKDAGGRGAEAEDDDKGGGGMRAAGGGAAGAP